MLRGMASVADPLLPVVAAILAGETYTGREARPRRDEAEFVVPGSVVRDLVLGRHGQLPSPVVRLTGVVIEGDIDLSYCEWRGNLTLLRCRVNGAVNLAHAHVRGRVSLTESIVKRIDVSNASIDGPLLFKRGYARDGFFGLGLTVSGSLNLSGSVLVAPHNKPNQCAVELFRAKLGDLFLGGAWLLGGLYANGMTVERNVRLQGLRATSRRELGCDTGPDNADGQAVSLTGTTVGAAIYLSWKDASRKPMRLTGSLVMTRVACASLHVGDDELAGVDVRLDGLQYERLTTIRPDRWLSLIERSNPGSNQPYVFFAAHCQAYGLTRVRRDALVAMHDRTAARQGIWTVDRVRWAAWKLFVRYGYQSARAIGWLAVAAVLCVLVLWLGGDFLVREASGADPGGRGLDDLGVIVAYALDSVLPFAGLGATDGWAARPEDLGQTVMMVLFVVVKFAGWGLAALGLASITGVAKRE
jgi:hypothetical protein